MITRFKTVGGLGIKFTQRRNLDKIKNWLKDNPEHVFESHHTPAWIGDIDPRKAGRLAGQTKRGLDLILKNPHQSPDPPRFTQFGGVGEMLRENDLPLQELRGGSPKQATLPKIDQMIAGPHNPGKEIVGWGYRGMGYGWGIGEVDLKTTLIMGGLGAGNHPGDDPKQAFGAQQFFGGGKLYGYYGGMGPTNEQKPPLFLRGGGPGAPQVGGGGTKIIFADTMGFAPGGTHNNDRLAGMRGGYLGVPGGGKTWGGPIPPVATLFGQRGPGGNTKLVKNLFGHIGGHHPESPGGLLHRLGVSFNNDGTVKLVAVMVRSFGYKKQNALPGLVHLNYRNIQPFGDTTGFKIIAPTNLVGSFAEVVINADLFLYDRKLFNLKFAEASNTRFLAYLPQVQFQIRQMVKELKTPEKELLQWIDTEEFWTLLDKEINTNFRALTSVPTTTLERQMILFEIYKQCTPVAALLKEKPDLEVQLKLLFMTFANEFQG